MPLAAFITVTATAEPLQIRAKDVFNIHLRGIGSEAHSSIRAAIAPLSSNPCALHMPMNQNCKHFLFQNKWPIHIKYKIKKLENSLGSTSSSQIIFAFILFPCVSFSTGSNDTSFSSNLCLISYPKAELPLWLSISYHLIGSSFSERGALPTMCEVLDCGMCCESNLLIKAADGYFPIL